MGSRHAMPTMTITRTVCAVILAGAVCGCCTTTQLLKQGRIDAHRRIAADDGTEIDVWIIKALPVSTADLINMDRPTVVLLHPMITDKKWFLPLGELLSKEGWNVVLPDLRAHGRSGGEHVTWGAREKYDIKKVVDTLVQQKLISPRVFAMGASLGGCVAIQYAAVDSRCEGVLALAPPTGLRGYIEASTWPLGTKRWIEDKIQRLAEQGGYEPDDASAVIAAGKLKCPVIFVHGRLDTTVPFSQVAEIHEAAAGPKKMIRLWADHGGVQMWCDQRLMKQMRMLARMAAAQDRGRKRE